MKSIYDYTDPLKYLKYRFKVLKHSNKKISHRSIALKLGYKSSATLSRIFSGKIKLSPLHAEKFIDIFKVSKKEAEYLRIIIGLNQFSSINKKIIHLDELTTFLVSNSKTITEERCKVYLDTFYNPIISEVSTDRLNNAYTVLKSYITNSEKDSAKKKFHKKKKSSSELTDEKENGLKKYFLELLSIADKIKESEIDEVNIMSFEINIPPPKIDSIREEIIDFCYKINKLSKKSDKNVKKYQINLQLFPVEPSK